MLFNSLEFLLFFPIVTIIYFLLPHKYRWMHLLLASCIFYMFFIPYYILILFFTIIIDYFAGIYLEKIYDPHKRRLFLAVSLIANIGVLAVFKYYNFFIENINQLMGEASINPNIPYLNIILPVGLSFHTFQAMSYTIEIYRGNQKAEKHFGIYALYVMFYPQLVAGPIERPQNIMHQFYMKHEFEYNRVVSGLRLMLWGFFKKVVIADNLANIVNIVYDNPSQQNAMTYLIAAFLFSIQIYCDFSGYSDIAIGSARVMGFKLMQNFNIPYISQSIREFWSRWHISLSTWFRDYLYIPLGGNRVSKTKQIINVMIVFLVSGLWHGANWTFVFWGALHGIYLISGILFHTSEYAENTFKKILNIGITFTLVTLAWIFFRAPDLTMAFHVLRTIAGEMFTDIRLYLSGVPQFHGLGEYAGKHLVLFILLTIIFLSIDILKETTRLKVYYASHSRFRMLTYFLLLYAILFLGYFGETQFIYFQF